jgi:hypothetical protein
MRSTPSGHLFWDGARWVAIWWDMDESRNVTAHAAFVDPSTRLFTTTDQPMAGMPQLDGADWNGTELLVPISIGAAGTDVALQTFDAAFRPIASVSLPISPARTVSVAWTGSDWQLAWESGEGTGVVPHPVRRARVTSGLALAESPEIVFPDVGYPANTVSLAVEGAHVGVGAGFSGVSTPPMGTYARFGRGGLGPIEDLRPFGALRTGAPASEVRVEVAPRRAVVWNERGTGDDGARLILLCEP